MQFLIPIVVVAGLVLVLRGRQNAAAAPTNPCEGKPLEQRIACELARLGINWLSTVGDQSESPQTINAGNGPCKRAWPKQAWKDFVWQRARGIADGKMDTCIEYENGCVPVDGNPGRMNCAAGTKDAFTAPYNVTTYHGQVGGSVYLTAVERKAYGRGGCARDKRDGANVPACHDVTPYAHSVVRDGFDSAAGDVNPFDPPDSPLPGSTGQNTVVRIGGN